ncbi:hypothetical protein [Neptunicella marina]|uniref:Uncharacterized protein n=1 Tax=Neptunicella marina TaxID=2125989 RepID=A0A8J6IWD6_9ALTE|nr:hypothetical protein [Neptunicella marina]MBC3766721.1 hypothetical protein [Neptunicella marina]
MSNKSLPAYLQQVLENHVAQSELTYDDELRDLFERLGKLNQTVEKLKATIQAKKQQPHH